MIDLSSFANDLKEGVKSGIPYPKNVELDEKKHKNTPKHIRDIALGNTEKYNNEFFFDLGNEQLERDYPYYHILEDSEVIHKRKKGTSTSKGSQATIIDKSKRDYGKILVHTTKSGKKVITKNIVKMFVAKEVLLGLKQLRLLIVKLEKSLNTKEKCQNQAQLI